MLYFRRNHSTTFSAVVSNYLRMNLRKLFGIKPKEKKPYEFADVLHMWEDDHLMIEFLPKDNLDFIKKESKRINEFGEEHFDGYGFTDITVIEEVPVKTIDKGLDFNSVAKIFENNGMERITEVVYQNVGHLTREKVPFGFGSNKFAVLLDGENGKLKYIWTTGRIENEELEQKFRSGLSEFAKTYDFLAIDWYKSESFDLQTENGMNEFIKNSC